MCHLDCLRRFPWDMIGWKLLDKQKSTNQPNQTLFLIMIERGDPLWLDNQPVRPHISKRWTSTSEYPDCHILLWNKLWTIVFVNSWRRSKVTLTDKIFKPIYNKVTPTTHPVKSQRRWFMGNVELFELCETIPKVQCKERLLYWNQGIVYCTCGHLLRDNESSRGILQWT